MPGDSDDAPVPRRGFVRPPPSGAPDRVQVPRMEPPPPSLEAMVYSTRRAPAGPRRSWLLLWALLLVMAAAVTAYFLR